MATGYWWKSVHHAETDAPKEKSCAFSTALHPSVVGIFHYGRKCNYVSPIDEKITQDIVIPGGQEFPEKEEAEAPEKPVRRGRRKKATSLDAHRGGRDPKPADAPEWDDLESVVVDVEITEWPTPTQNPKRAGDRDTWL